MQATVFTLFGAFVAFCWFSVRRERLRADGGGEAFDPGEGRLRWTVPPSTSDTQADDGDEQA